MPRRALNRSVRGTSVRRRRDADIDRRLDEERQRVVRDLHDGAQQSLVALSTRIAVAESLAQDQEELAQLLREARADLVRAMDEIRAAVSGAGPHQLASLGLRHTLKARAALAPVPIAVRCPPARYPRRVETCVYFCCAEAIQNLVKHAGASRGRVRVTESAGRVHFEVWDDGRGFDPGRALRGRGLANLRDRVEALGGTLVVSSAPGSGTTVAGWVPVRRPRMPSGHGRLSLTLPGTAPVH